MALIQVKPNKQLLLFGLIFVVLIGVFVYWNKYRSDYNKAKQIIGTDSNEQNAQLVEKVGKLIDLPQGETPTFATVTDTEKLKNQPFFQRAKNGDKVLIYSQSQKAILYRPSINKIIEVTFVNTKPVSVSPQPQAASASAGVNVVIWNGTSSVGITKNVENLLVSKIAGLKVLEKDNAGRSTYTQTLVIDLSGKQKETAQKIAKELNGVTSALPAEETKPAKGDVLIIVGKNFVK